jgi:hypothetical protein
VGLDCLFKVVGLPWLHYITSLADVTMVTQACKSPYSRNDIKALLASGMTYLSISFETTCRIL